MSGGQAAGSVEESVNRRAGSMLFEKLLCFSNTSFSVLLKCTELRTFLVHYSCNAKI